MISAVLSIVSSSALWAVCQDGQILDHLVWDDNQSVDLSQQIGIKLKELLSRAHIATASIEEIFVVDGPGAFTGLRSSAAFAKGFAEARGIPAYGIPTFLLYRDPQSPEPIFIPLQHQRVRGLSFEDALKSGVEFLKISGPRLAEVAAPAAQSTVLGIDKLSAWPEAANIAAALKRVGDKKTAVDLYYGLNPKISGKR